MELTILMPCLNEAETLAICVRKARRFLSESGIDGEVLIADNGSSDGSQEIAANEGARVIHVEQKGYGSALIAGCNAALGQYVIMGDSDDSYDFLHLMSFVDKLRAGCDLVMGNRFAGGIEKGAMPFSHRYIGNPVLSFIGRLFFHSKIRDFHCGLRGYNRQSIANLNLKTTGMEYASEMVVMAELNGLRIEEVPTTLKKDGRSTPPHLRSFRDGWRHLKFLFLYCPNWLFLYPGIFLCIIGIIGGAILIAGNLTVGGVAFGIHTLLYMAFCLIIGVNIIFLFAFTKVYAANNHFISKSRSIEALERFSVDRGILIGAILSALGIALTIAAFVIWGKTGFSELTPEQTMRVIIPATALTEIGVQFIFASFFIGILEIRSEPNVKGN